MGLLHPISVGGALLVGSALLTLGRRLLTPNHTWADLTYFSRYSLLISATAMSFGYFAFATLAPWSTLGLPDLGKWTGVVLWILAGVMAGIGAVMVLVVRLSNRLSRKSTSIEPGTRRGER